MSCSFIILYYCGSFVTMSAKSSNPNWRAGTVGVLDPGSTNVARSGRYPFPRTVTTVLGNLIGTVRK